RKTVSSIRGVARSRRRFLVGSGTLALASLLAACAPAPSNTPAPPAAQPAAPTNTAAPASKPAEPTKPAAAAQPTEAPKPAAAAQPTEAPKPAAAAPAKTGTVAIGVSVWGDITDKQTYDNITDDFMKANPTI